MAQVPTLSKHYLSDKVEHFTESVIREMTRQAMHYGAINLAQGFPDFPAPAEIKRAAQQAIADDVNQYAITWSPCHSCICRAIASRRFRSGRGSRSIQKKRLWCAVARPRR